MSSKNQSEFNGLGLHKLSQTPLNKRNQSWEEAFLLAFSKAKLAILTENVQMGPDGWPYLFLSTDLDGGVTSDSQASGPQDQAKNILQWAYENGTGLVVNPQKDKPDYIFNYGMIWAYVHRQKFVSYFDENYPEDAGVYISKVTDDILPPHPRHLLKEYIASAGVEEPRAALITRDKLNYELAFGIESLNNPPEEEHEGIAKGMSWFMPTDIPIVLLYEEKFQKLYQF